MKKKVIDNTDNLEKAVDTITRIAPINASTIEETRTYIEIIEDYLRTINENINELRQSGIDANIDEQLGNANIKIDLMLTNVSKNLLTLETTNEALERVIIHKERKEE